MVWSGHTTGHDLPMAAYILNRPGCFKGAGGWVKGEGRGVGW